MGHQDQIDTIALHASKSNRKHCLLGCWPSSACVGAKVEQITVERTLRAHAIGSWCCRGRRHLACIKWR